MACRSHLQVSRPLTLTSAQALPSFLPSSLLVSSTSFTSPILSERKLTCDYLRFI